MGRKPKHLLYFVIMQQNPSFKFDSLLSRFDFIDFFLLGPQGRLVDEACGHTDNLKFIDRFQLSNFHVSFLVEGTSRLLAAATLSITSCPFPEGDLLNQQSQFLSDGSFRIYKILSLLKI